MIWVPILEAATAAGRSVEALRRWIARGLLTSEQRRGASHRYGTYVPLEEVQKVAAGQRRGRPRTRIGQCCGKPIFAAGKCRSCYRRARGRQEGLL